MIKGIDVSHWQGNINWPAVRNAGYKFAFVKLTDGQNYTDPKGVANIKSAKAAGLIVGAYHFARFRNVAEAVREAMHFKFTVADLGLSYVILDIEDTSLEGDLTNAAIEFLNAVLSIAQPVLYSGPAYIRSHFNSQITKYPLWIAHYGVSKPMVPLWGNWSIWQYTSTGSVPGIRGNVDINFMQDDFLKKKEGNDMAEKLVIAYDDGDWNTASLVAYKNGCACILRDIFENHKAANQARKYIVVGGPGNYVPGPNAIYLSGNDRVKTALKALA